MAFDKRWHWGEERHTATANKYLARPTIANLVLPSLVFFLAS